MAVLAVSRKHDLLKKVLYAELYIRKILMLLPHKIAILAVYQI